MLECKCFERAPGRSQQHPGQVLVIGGKLQLRVCRGAAWSFVAFGVSSARAPGSSIGVEGEPAFRCLP